MASYVLREWWDKCLLGEGEESCVPQLWKDRFIQRNEGIGVY